METQNYSKLLVQYALRLLGRRAYSEQEIKNKFVTRHKLLQKLKGTQISENCILEALQYLKDKKLLDDSSYSQALSDSLARRGKSRKYIAQKLSQKGIAKEEIEESLKGTVDSAEAIKKQILQKCRQNISDLKDAKTKAKVIRGLMSRGFSYQDITNAIKEILGS